MDRGSGRSDSLEDKVEQLVGVVFKFVAHSEIHVKGMGRRSLMVFGGKRLDSQSVRSDLSILRTC